MSANGVGKTLGLAVGVLWWLYARGPSAVVSVAPTERQSRELLWGEIRRLFLNATPQLPGELFTSALRVSDKDRWYAVGFSTNDANRLTGFHHDRLLIVLDEAQGLDAQVWEGAYAVVTGEGNRICAIGNPGAPTGRWFDITRGDGWKGIRISAMDHPNVVTGTEVIPGAVSQRFIDRLAAEYGKGSSVFANRVLGEFADDADESLVSRQWLGQAAARWAEAEPAGQLPQSVVCALDVARYGVDESVLAIRDGRRLVEFVTWTKSSTMESAGRVLYELRDRGLDPTRVRIVIDSVGVGGGVIDALREQDLTQQFLVEYNGGGSPKDPRFANRRAEDYWKLRRELEEGRLDLPDDIKLFDELAATKWRINPAGKLELEAKDKTKARLGRSPDRSDALVMAIAGPGQPLAVMAVGIPQENPWAV